MKLPKIAVNRPITTLMSFIAIFLFGSIALYFLPADVLPDIELPAITVITVYPGASADEVEEQISKKLETVLAATENLKSISSTSKENVSFISLQFNWNTDITEAVNDARAKIDLIKQELPDDALSPSIMKINSALMPVTIYAVNADENYYGLGKIIEDQIAAPLRKVEGVGTVFVIAEPQREIKVNLIPEKLNAYHLTPNTIATIIKAENITIPGGNIKVGSNDFAVRVPGEVGNVEALKNLVILHFNNKIIQLKDVAEIVDGFEENDEIARAQGKRAVALLVQKQTGANTLDVYRKTSLEVTKIQEKLPSDVKIKELINSSEIVEESIKNLSHTIFWAGLFVVFVVFFFLREWRSSLIIILTIPFSLIIAFISMYLLGYTINIFSLMSLVIAIGMVVDNAIVVLENITQHIENGSRAKQAAIFGTSEMGTAITASTLTTISVFIPMIFMDGIVGIMFEQLAIITSITLIASLITALTLTPMLSSKLLSRKMQSKHQQTKFFKFSEKLFNQLENGYKKMLFWAINHKLMVIVSAFLIFILTAIVAVNIGSDYIPEIDAGDVSAVIQTKIGTSSRETERIAKKVEDIFIAEIPEIKSCFTVAGQTKKGLLTMSGFSEGKNMATIIAHLSLPEERERSSKEIAQIISDKIETIPEIEKFHVTGGSLLSAALLGTQKPVEVKITGNDFKKLYQTSDLLVQEFSKNPAFSDVESTADKGKLELQIIIDKEKASGFGLNTAMIALQIRQSIYGVEAGNYKESGDNFTIKVQYDPAYINKIENLKNIMITTINQQQIPLSSIAEITESIGPLEIKRESQQRIVKVKASLNNVSLGEAKMIAQEILNNQNFDNSVSVELSGQLSEQEDSFSSLIFILIIGALLVYMIMASQFESLKDPFIIIFAIPFSFIGIIWAFKITGLTLSVVTFVGVIMLLGIVVNNGIVLVDYTNLLRKRNYNLNEAVLEAGRSRLRPVLMTTFTTLLGMLPMALSTGIGSEMWSPLGITIIGGLLISTLITLILIPVIYYLFNQKNESYENHLLHL